MKKYIALLLAVLMLASVLTSCANNVTENENETVETMQPEQDLTPETDVDTETKPEEKPEDKPVENKPENTPEQKPEEKPEVKPETTPEQKPETTPEQKPVETPSATISMELSAIVDAMYQKYDPMLPVGTIPVDLTDEFSLSSFTGLSDASLIKEAIASESMIGSQAYSVVLVRLNDSADAKTVAQAMKDGINTRKWICVEADDLRVVACDDVVLLVMISSSLDVKTDSVIDAFGSVIGKSFSVDLQ